MKNIPTFEDFVNESLLLESFQSITLAQFKASFVKDIKYGDKLPKGILWDQIPEEEVIGREDPSFNKKTVGKDNSYVVFWYNANKQLVKWRQPSYAYGPYDPIDKSTYLRPGTLMITRGLNYLVGGYDDLLLYKPSENKYNKPANGDLAVSRLYDELECQAFAIKWDTLEKYSAANLRTSRAEARKGALALMKQSDILRTNQYRYEDAIKAGQLNRETKPIADKVNKITEDLKKQIEKAGQIPFSEMVIFSKGKYSNDDAIQTAYFNKIDYSKVESLVKEYNEIAYAYNSWFKEFKGYIGNKSDAYKRWADDAMKSLDAILAKY